MSTPTDSYRVTAKYYDAAYAAKPELDDFAFYLELAKRARGPVLEIGCGTGRVLLPLAREGVIMHGVDNSGPMLRVLEDKLRQEPAEVRERVRLSAGDMREFRLAEKFELVILPFRPLQHMYTVEDQVRALRTAQFHLSETGRLAFDVFFPKFEAQAGSGEEFLDLEWAEPESSRVVRRYFRMGSVDKVQQILSGTFTYRTFEGERLVQEEVEPLKMSYYTYPQMRALFLLAGLEVVEEYGSFAKAPLDENAKEMIFVGKRSG